jgi:hypothetical protein
MLAIILQVHTLVWRYPEIIAHAAFVALCVGIAVVPGADHFCAAVCKGTTITGPVATALHAKNDIVCWNLSASTSPAWTWQFDVLAVQLPGVP